MFCCKVRRSARYYARYAAYLQTGLNQRVHLADVQIKRLHVQVDNENSLPDNVAVCIVKTRYHVVLEEDLDEQGLTGVLKQLCHDIVEVVLVDVV